jgi:hypothetical protein
MWPEAPAPKSKRHKREKEKKGLKQAQPLCEGKGSTNRRKVEGGKLVKRKKKEGTCEALLVLLR